VKIADPRDILVAPVISEKSYGLLDENKYTFEVRTDANKTQIRQAVESVFGVKVTGVNTINRQGKRKRTRFGYGKRKDTKRAIVSLAEGGSTSSEARSHDLVLRGVPLPSEAARARPPDAGHRGGPVRIGKSSEDRQGMNEKDGHP
jgi:large subunit ribosomal protein L23